MRHFDNITIFVNTSDSYSDCWSPFFLLLKKYCNVEFFEIILNTEVHEYEYPGLRIRCVKNSINSNRRLTWSEAFLCGLNAIRTPYCIYLQEDYFIENPVSADELLLAIKTLQSENLDCLQLTKFGSRPPYVSTLDPVLSNIRQYSFYRISTQAAIWKVESLKKNIREWESGWMFEIFGTFRSWRKQDRFSILNSISPVFQYQHTGIIKGKWADFIPELFAKEGILCDLNVRGFYDYPNPIIRRLKLLFNLIKTNPINIMRSLFS